jgi:ribonuclease D
MPSSSHAVVAPKDAAKTSKVHWPLAYRIQPQKPKVWSLKSYGFSSTRAAPKRWWSHRLYRGPEGKEVEVLYSKTKAQSEVYAKQFLDEAVVGFDMEWPWNDWKKDDLQNKVGLIQIASEDKIALFHIGLHPGKTSEEIIAPTLKRIIEDPKIGKVGVNILSADFSRLSRYFGLEPKGAIESSHLYRLVKFGSSKPELVSVKLVSLAHQVEEQLSLPLYKGDVRTSNWSKPLSKDQMDYAAGDAYAGFMLYKCMNAKRLTMSPTPPLPIHAELYPSGKASRDDPILLDVGDGTTITTEAFFGVKPAKSGTTGTTSNAQKKARTSGQPLDHISQALFEELAVRRASLAETGKIQPSRVISDALLEAIACAQPYDTAGLLDVKGIGKIQQAKYGDQWLEVISLFHATNGIERPAETVKSMPSKPEIQPPHTPRGSKALRKAADDSSGDSSPAFETAPPRTPQLHTGLSFTMADTKIGVEKGNKSDGSTSSYDSDDTLPSLDFGSPSRRRTSAGTKRKRAESPEKIDVEKAIQPPRELSQNSTTIIPRTTLASEAAEVQPPNATTPSTSNAKFTQDPSLNHALEMAGKSGALASALASVQGSLLSPSSRIARSKLLAFSKLVTRKLPARPATAPPIITEHTLDLIIKARPQTQDELERIPGVDSLLLACEKTGMDLLRNVVKFAPLRS